MDRRLGGCFLRLRLGLTNNHTSMCEKGESQVFQNLVNCKPAKPLRCMLNSGGFFFTELGA